MFYNIGLMKDKNSIKLDNEIWFESDFIKKCNEKPCVIEAFFEKERQKPIHLRSNMCMISCNCPRCAIYC